MSWHRGCNKLEGDLPALGWGLGWVSPWERGIPGSTSPALARAQCIGPAAGGRRSPKDDGLWGGQGPGHLRCSASTLQGSLCLEEHDVK